MVEKGEHEFEPIVLTLNREVRDHTNSSAWIDTGLQTKPLKWIPNVVMIKVNWKDQGWGY